MSKEELFEEIELDKNETSDTEKTETIQPDEDMKSEKTNCTNIVENLITTTTTTQNFTSSEIKRESKFYHEFMVTNKDYFERIGFKDISDDAIFDLDAEMEMKKNVNLYECEICKKEISRIFTRNKFW
jgi:hypothetical protein